MAKEKSLEDIIKEANSTPPDKVVKNIKQEVLTKEQVTAIIRMLSDNFGISEAAAFITIASLFLKGASNNSAPQTMSVQVTTQDGQTTEITKYDLVYAYSRVANNKFIRRLAEALSKEISQYAEKNGLNGDLAVSLNNKLLAKGEKPLTTKEKAWANSFCQNTANLDTLAGERIPSLLAEDYMTRFANKKPNKKNYNKEKNTTPRNWRAGNTGRKPQENPSTEGPTPNTKPAQENKNK